MLKNFITKVVEGIDLNEEESFQVMELIMTGEVPPTQIASFLTALRMKGETIFEITGFAKAMRKNAVKIKTNCSQHIIDTCGTGGDGKGTFNISTAVAFVIAGGGCIVAKHHNRSVSSSCGSADVLEELGIDPDLPPHRAELALQEFGLAFLFAPRFHPATRYAAGARREIGIRTVFNLLGPLTNPADAKIHLAGIYRKDLTESIAKVLKNLGSHRAMVVHSEEGCDEISISGSTIVTELKNGSIETYIIEPEMFGLKRSPINTIRGGSPQENAKIILNVLNGEKGPQRDIILLNAAAVFLMADKVSTLNDGIKMAMESIDSGNAIKKLYELREFSRLA